MLGDKDKTGTTTCCHAVGDPVGSSNGPYSPGIQTYQQPQQPVRGCHEPGGQRSLPYPSLPGVRLKSLREGGRVDAASVLLSFFPQDGARVQGTEWGVCGMDQPAIKGKQGVRLMAAPHPVWGSDESSCFQPEPGQDAQSPCPHSWWW